MKQQGKEGASFQGIIGVRWKKGVFLLSLCLCVMFSIFTPFVTKAIYSYLFRDILSFSTFLLFSTQNKTIAVISFSLFLNSVFISSLILNPYLSMFLVHSVFPVAKKSTLYANEMCSFVYLPVYIIYNHRTLYMGTSVNRQQPHFTFFINISILVMACLAKCSYPITTKFRKVMPIA